MKKYRVGERKFKFRVGSCVVTPQGARAKVIDRTTYKSGEDPIDPRYWFKVYLVEPDRTGPIGMHLKRRMYLNQEQLKKCPGSDK